MRKFALLASLLVSLVSSVAMGEDKDLGVRMWLLDEGTNTKDASTYDTRIVGMSDDLCKMSEKQFYTLINTVSIRTHVQRLKIMQNLGMKTVTPESRADFLKGGGCTPEHITSFLDLINIGADRDLLATQMKHIDTFYGAGSGNKEDTYSVLLQVRANDCKIKLEEAFLITDEIAIKYDVQFNLINNINFGIDTKDARAKVKKAGGCRKAIEKEMPGAIKTYDFYKNDKSYKDEE